MSIRPIDTQVTIQRTSEISKVKSDEQSKNSALAQEQALNTQKQANEGMKKVQGKEKAYKTVIQKDKEKEKGKDGKGEDKNKKKNSDGTHAHCY